MPLNREQIVRRAAQKLHDGYYVNLGIGIPRSSRTAFRRA